MHTRKTPQSDTSVPSLDWLPILVRALPGRTRKRNDLFPKGNLSLPCDILVYGVQWNPVSCRLFFIAWV